MLEENGKKTGEALLKRHNPIEVLLRLLGVSGKVILIETKKVEHTLSDEAIKCFEGFISFIKDNPDIIIRYDAYRSDMDTNKDSHVQKDISVIEE